jgi:SAM-dependent methyltransferase
MENTYTRTWFELFMKSVAPTQTGQEVAFLRKLLPLRDFSRILDVCCGAGRHAEMLVAHGYAVTGLDRDEEIIRHAKKQPAAKAEYLMADMRHLHDVPGLFDAVLNLWQSFGYFDNDTNLDVLRQVHEKLRSGGRFVLDVYHREFFKQHLGEQTFEKDGMIIREHKTMHGERLKVELDYGTQGKRDVFDWHLYTPDELQTIAEQAGFRLVLSCAWFNEDIPASPEHARMQLVFEK